MFNPNFINYLVEVLFVFLGVFLAFLLNNYQEVKREKKQFNLILELIKSELKNNLDCLENDNIPAISFETFKSLTGNTIFIKFINQHTYEILWKTYAALRQFKYAKEHHETPKDNLFKKWFEGEIQVQPIINIIIKIIDGEKIKMGWLSDFKSISLKQKN